METPTANPAIGKRTKIDFSKHELLLTKQEGLLIHSLKKPDTHYDSIKYINTSGILAITGDYSNWIFCREFHPSKTESRCDDSYWKQKLKIGSCQEPAKYDAERTHQELKEMLADEEQNWSEEDKEFLTELLTYTDDEIEYAYEAYRNGPSNFDLEYIPFVKTVDYHFLAILDGFEEICRRLAALHKKTHCFHCDLKLDNDPIPIQSATQKEAGLPCVDFAHRHCIEERMKKS